MMRRVAIFGSLIIAGLLLGALGAHFAGQRNGDPSADDLRLRSGGDFTLDSANGPVALAELRGKVVLIYFGYASCPDVCPTSLAIIAAALRTLTPGERERVRAMFVSVDPLRDTPTKLKQYVGYFHPNIIGVTGRPADIARVALRYGASYGFTPVQSAVGYVVDHTSVTSVVAPDGRLVEQLPHGTTAPQMVATIRRWLSH
jgi:protein SCO1/2